MAEFEGVVFLLYNTARRQASAGHSTISNLIPLKQTIILRLLLPDYKSNLSMNNNRLSSAGFHKTICGSCFLKMES